MNNFRARPQTITLLMICLSLLPRLLSEYAFLNGTVIILIFWISPLVLFPEFINSYTTETFSIRDLHISIKLILAFVTIITVYSFWWRGSIYEVNNSEPFNFIRGGLYLINPIIYFSWFYLVDKKQLRKFLLVGFVLSIGLIFSVLLPRLVNNANIGNDINILTAKCAAHVYSFFSGTIMDTEGQFFFNDNFSIKVGVGCSSTPQIVISLYSILAMYLCCQITSKKYIIIVIIFAIIIPFTINIFRVSLLGYFVSMQKTNSFDFWHHGAGSFIFSLITMFTAASIFYFLWSKENPFNKKV